MTAVLPIDDEILQEIEANLTNALKLQGASPYLGHYDFPDIRPRALRAIRMRIGERIDKSRILFAYWPLTTVWIIASELAFKYGKAGDPSVYPIVADIFGIDLSPQWREELLRRFRNVCARHGLNLPAPHEEVAGIEALPLDDYFSQAGVPIEQLDSLATIFRKAEATWGEPSVDATMELTRWENDAIEHFCPDGLRRLRKILLFDSTAFHSELYARLRKGDSPLTPFELAFHRAIEAAKDPPRSKVPRPALIYSNGQLELSDIQGGAGFELEVNGRRSWVRPAETATIPLPWPESLRWRTDTNDATDQKSISVLGQGTVYLIFDATSGRLERTLQSADKGPLGVPLGQVVVISRAPFRLGDKEAFESCSGCYELYSEIEDSTTLTNGHDSFELRPIQRPFMRVLGSTPIGSSHGHDWIAAPHSIEVLYQGLELDLEVHLAHRALAGGSTWVPLVRDSSGRYSASLSSVLPLVGPFDLLRLELKQAGQARKLLTAAVWYWPGLRGLERGQRFDASQLPPNLDRQSSLNVEERDGALWVADPARTPYTEARVVFTSATGSSVLASFRLPPPGISVLLLESDGTQRALRVGQTLAIAPDDGASVIFQVPDAAGVLDILGDRESRSFNRFGRRQLRTAGLSAAGDHNRVRYCHPNKPDHWQTVLVLQQLAAPIDFTPLVVRGRVGFEAHFAEPVVRARAEIAGVLHGSIAVADSHLGEAELLSQHDGGAITFTISSALVAEADLYVLRPEVQFADGRWRDLTNGRQDRFEFGYHHGISVGKGQLPLRENEASVAFSRASRVLDHCIAPPCWTSMETGLLPVWENLATELRRNDGLWSQALLRSSMADWLTDSSSTWVPICHPLELAHELLSAPVGDFLVAAGDSAADGTEHLGWLGRLDGAHGALASIQNAGVSLLVAGAFSNAAAVNKNPAVPLVGFSFAQFAAALDSVGDYQRDSYWTERHDRLTHSHHTWCCARLMERIARIRRPGQNIVRLADVVEIAVRALPAARETWTSYGDHTIALSPPGALDDEWPMLRNVIELISAWARASRYGVTDTYLTHLSEHTGRAMRAALRSLGLLLRLGPELFGFYLLLWEIANRGDVHDE